MDWIGGTETMVVGAFASALVCALIASALHRSLGWFGAITWGALIWWMSVIGLVTLVPLTGIDLTVPAGARSDTCSLDYGGPAPYGFWIFSGGQRLLNTALFVPAGALWVLVSARWRTGWVAAPLGLLLLGGSSFAIELLQLEVARIDRACDVTDLVDNVTGAAIGFGVGLLLTPLLRPRRRR